MIFILGGNGTHAGANAIHNEVLQITFLFSWKKQIPISGFKNETSIDPIGLFASLHAVQEEEDESISHMCSKDN